MDTIRIGILGSGGIARTHADALKELGGNEIVSVFSRSIANAQMFAEWKGVPAYFDDVDRFLQVECDLVLVCLPNDRHAPDAIRCIEAGRHVMIEKPVAMSIEEVDAIEAAAKKQGVRVFYGEELPFVPRFAEVRSLIEQGAVGDVYMVRQVEKHAGPYSPWFFARETAGGGALMDMGCHGIELIRWLLGDAQPVSVSAMIDTFMHDTALDDHALVNMRFENGTIGVSESSWTLQGGMESVVEVYGTGGVIRAEVLRDTGVAVYSQDGYGMMADEAKGWHHVAYDHDREHGYVGEFAHFFDCLRTEKETEEGLPQARAVFEILLASYESARTGQTVKLPFTPKGVAAPIDLWKPEGK